MPVGLRGFSRINRGFAARGIALYGIGSDPSAIDQAPLHIRPVSTAPTDAAEGDIYYDSDIKALLVHNGTAWQGLANGAPRRVIAGNTATLTLTAADSGSIVVFDRAAGCAVTLPVAAAGLQFDFYVLTSVTSNAYSITAGEDTDLFIGGVFSIDTDTSNAVAFFAPDGSDDDAMSMNGNTTGGLLGSHVRFTALSNSRWLVEGRNHGSGTVATPFA